MLTTFFVPDVAYHITKWERGFEKVVNIQGTDHHGTIARVRAGLQAANVGIPKGYPDYVLHTMVRVVRGGEEVKISKRAGSYVTLRDLIEWTSKDAVRFFLLSRKPDTEYTFDVDLAVQKNNDNPVYYVQYAHARICSVLAAWGGDAASLKDVDLSALDSPAAQALMLLLAKYPAMLADAARDFAPHDITFYLRELAACYHSYYDAERILVDDEAVKKARMKKTRSAPARSHVGGTLIGFVIGVLVGLAGALAVAIYVTKVPMPFVDRGVSRKPAQDAAEAERNKGWNPNAVLGGKPAPVPGAGNEAGAIVVPPADGKPRPPAPAAPTAEAPSSGAPNPATVDGFSYFVQAGAFRNPDEADAQRARLAMLGMAADISEREQSGQTVYRVRVGPFAQKAMADATREQLEANGVAAALVRVQR